VGVTVGSRFAGLRLDGPRQQASCHSIPDRVEIAHPRPLLERY
jgi:hypothetical protein